MGDPRLHHYLFAHRILPDFTLNQGPDLLSTLARDGQVFLDWIWSRLAEDLPPAEHLDPEGLTFSLHELGPWHIVLITLPPAEHTTEAHMVAAVAQLHPLGWGQQTYGTFRCFTLERTDAHPATSLCEWTLDAHLHIGPGPAVDPDAFLQAVLGQLEFAD